jgi:prepilin-type N-terminal cleavage/methylation domain-containing protein
MLRRTQRGFTLTEMAVVLTIVALLMVGAMMTLSAQIEVRSHEETRRRLNAAVEALVAFAIVNRRLPCPATAGTTGDEAPTGGGPCTTNFAGFLPARTLGLPEVDAQGYALDVWGNRIRYAISNAVLGGVSGCGTPVGPPFFTSQANLKANGVGCRPNDLDICAPTGAATACTAANRVSSTQTVVLVVFSTGKNGALPAAQQGAHELANTDGVNAAFISRTPTGIDALNGAFDDLMVWMPAGVFYSKLITAGVLP